LKTGLAAMAAGVFLPAPPVKGAAIRRVVIPVKPLKNGDLGPGVKLAG